MEEERILSEKLVDTPPKLNGDTIPVSEIFYSIQGEGPYAGLPAVFLRTTYCNLWCDWCDTKFTWKRGMIETQTMAVETVAQKILEHGEARLLVVTGGEPLLHMPQLSRIFETTTTKRELAVEIETNGTITPSTDLDQQVTHYDVSPKLSNSGIEWKYRTKPETLAFYNSSQKADFKFVIVNEHDVQEVLDLVGRGLVNRRKVLLMPEGVDPEIILQRSLWLVEACKKHGFRFSPRLHVWLWGNRRGV